MKATVGTLQMEASIDTDVVISCMLEPKYEKCNVQSQIEQSHVTNVKVMPNTGLQLLFGDTN